MPDLEVITEEIRAAGDAAQEVAETVRPIDVGAVSDAAEAIPDAQAVNLFKQLEKHLAGAKLGLRDTGTCDHCCRQFPGPVADSS